MFRRLWRFAAPMAAIALFTAWGSTPARADSVAPGGGIGAPSTISLPPIGGLAASITNANYAQVNSLSQTVGTGTYDVWVYSPDVNNSGFTTIVFDVKVLTGDIGRVTLTNFGGYTTDVYTDGSYTNALGVGRTPDGSTLGFNFTNASQQAILTPGSNAGLFIIRTNSPSWSSGNISLIDSATADEISFAPVPLPATANMGFALLGCLGGFGAFRRLKLKRECELV